MHYFLDFDRTVFDTPAFKRAFANRATGSELVHQGWIVLKEFFNPSRTVSMRRIITRTFGTFASHGRFGFTPGELRSFLYPDSIEFFEKHAKDTTIVTFGIRAFITAKVTNALTDVPLRDIVYTGRKKGRTIRRLTAERDEPCVFVDDAHFQLASVARACPKLRIVEIRRDHKKPDGRWPVIRSLRELESA